MELALRAIGEIGRLLPYALFFLSLAVITKRTKLWDDVRLASAEIRTTFGFFVVDIIFVAPVAAVIAAWPVSTLGLNSAAAPLWRDLSPWLVLPAALLIGDYAGYWRHRLSHHPLLWPIHVAHHSDRALNWFSLIRTHPLERLFTATVDSAVLALCGLPMWAIAANNFARASWGFLIHADLPWTFGKLGGPFISPSAHRWHHVRDPAFAGKNFATLFTFWDRIHGTYKDSVEPCRELTGVEGHDKRFFGELIYPFQAITVALVKRPRAFGGDK